MSPARRTQELRDARRVFGATVLLALGAVALALYTQHGLDMQPCSWCVLIRLIFVAMALVALPGWLLRSAALHRVLAALLLMAAAGGVAASLWLHFVAASSTSCSLSLADRIVGGLGLDARWPEVFAAYASCSDAAVSLFGVPYVVFSLVLFVAAGAAAIWMLRRGR